MNRTGTGNGPRDRTGVSGTRLRSPASAVAVVALLVSAIVASIGTVLAGHLANAPRASVVALLAVVLVGSALAETAGKWIWVGVINRASATLREDLLSAVLAQPLETLGEQAAGELLDRIDDDTQEVATLLRMQVWQFAGTAFALVPLWTVAGLTWWPAWFVFPVFATLLVFVTRPLLQPIAERKIVEEAAWTEHAAALEEGIAGRDDIRTSLGQSFVVARVAQLSAEIHRRVQAVLEIETRLLTRAGLLLHGLLVLIVLLGALLVSHGRESVGTLVTLFLVTSGFVGALSQLAEQLPDLQAGLGAVMRLRGLLEADAEPVGGRSVPDGPLGVEFCHLDFRYRQGAFGLHDVDLRLPAGRTLALVGRTGSGKSTLASLLTRALEPPRGTVRIGGVDVVDLDLGSLRSGVGVVSQRTEMVSGTLAENIALYEPIDRDVVEDIVERLGLRDWVASLPDGLDTMLGAGGAPLSAGEEQLVAFARLLARDVRVVILDEATARMDPLTEARVVAAASQLLVGRTGLLIAHRLSTIERADMIAVLESGHLIQAGPRRELTSGEGPFRRLLEASGADPALWGASAGALDAVAEIGLGDSVEREGGGSATEQTASKRRTSTAPQVRELPASPSLARGMVHALLVTPRWGLFACVFFAVFALTGATGAITGYFWGDVAIVLKNGENPWWPMIGLAISVLAGPLCLTGAVRRFPHWWIEVSLRARMAILLGQTDQRRLAPTSAGEVVGRAMDSERYVRYADRWIDFVNGLLIAAVTAVVAGSWLAGAVLLGIMAAAAASATVGRPVAGRSAVVASAARARFGRVLVSVLEAARTVKLAGRTEAARRHVLAVDEGRVDASIREQRVRAVLDAIPSLLVQVGIVLAWAGTLWGWWGLATALLVANVAAGFGWFGRVAGAVVTDVPGTRAWQVEATRLAGGRDLVRLPSGVDLVTGAAPAPSVPLRVPLETVSLQDVDVVHEDGTVGVMNASLTIDRGELVLLLGRVGSGKSSLLKTLAGLVPHRGRLAWNGAEVADPEIFLRPPHVAYVAQMPRVFSGTFLENVLLDHDRSFDTSVADARLDDDLVGVGGAEALVGHRGVRLSGGQVQRVALARALAADAELLVADDVSSALDARTEVELWTALAGRGATVVGATSKRAALERADRVVVLVDGAVVAQGHWSDLAETWGELAG